LTVHGDLQDKLNSVQDKLDFTQECKKILKHSLREKEEQIAILEGKLQCTQNNKSKQLTPREAVSLQHSLNNEQSQIILLHRSIVDKDSQTSSLRADLHNTQNSYNQILHQRNQLSHKVTGHDEQLSALHLENDILANRVACCRKDGREGQDSSFQFLGGGECAAQGSVGCGRDYWSCLWSLCGRGTLIILVLIVIKVDGSRCCWRLC
jgi:chromosome segregation ATPase